MSEDEPVEVTFTEDDYEDLARVLIDEISSEMTGERCDESMARTSGLIAEMLQGPQADAVVQDSVDIVLDLIPGVGGLDVTHRVLHSVVDRLLGERADEMIRRSVETTMGELTTAQNEEVSQESLAITLDILEREGRLDDVGRRVAERLADDTTSR